MSTVVRVPLRFSSPPARLPVLPQRPVWMDRALCSGTDDPVFFDVSNEPAQAELAEEKYCGRCPVWASCLTFALKTRSRGVWAGTTFDKRQSVARTRKRKSCPACRCVTLISVGRHDLCTACGVSWKTGRGPDELEQETTDGDDDR